MVGTHGIPVLEVCKYITSKCTMELRPVNNLQLQKLLYDIQKEFIKENKVGLFKEDIEAWEFGPVVPVAYRYYSIYGAMPIIETDETYVSEFTDSFSVELLDIEIIDKVIEESYKRNNWSIRDESHKEGGPWYRAYYSEDTEGNIITLESIQEYGLE